MVNSIHYEQNTTKKLTTKSIIKLSMTMETLTIQKQIQSEQLYLPEIKNLIGKTVEIIFIVKPSIEPKTSKFQNFFEAAGNILLDENELYNFRKMSMI